MVEKRNLQKEATVLEHLEELRYRLILIIVGIIIALCITYPFSKNLLHILISPLLITLPKGSHIVFTGLTEAFWMRVQISLVAAVFLSSPWSFLQTWLFVKPGLKIEERRIAIPLITSLTVFFISGAFFAYKLVFPYAFKFLLSYGGGELMPLPGIKQYISFALKLIFAFGIVFEMPIVSFFLSRLGLIDAKTLIKKADYAILIIFIVAAIFTPPDVFTQLLMAGPLILLYGLSIVVAAIFSTRKRKIYE
ncbi:MAG: twin-arginine translocase subunit TatC [Deltaproteobacteria bacterium]|nr:twin-arginine translocase subunit TatC [Deltaproteobacteria bacterium]